MKLASLKGPTRDGTLVVVNRDLTRAVKEGIFGLNATVSWPKEEWGLDPSALEHRLVQVMAAVLAGGSVDLDQQPRSSRRLARSRAGG